MAKIRPHAWSPGRREGDLVHSISARVLTGEPDLHLIVFCLALALALFPLPQARSQADPRAEIRSLLEQRALAVVSADEERFSSTLTDPSSTEGQEMLSSWRAWSSLPLRTYRLVPKFDDLGDLARPSDLRHYPQAEDVRIYLVQEQYSFKTYDAKRVFQDLYLTFVLQDGTWTIASEGDLDALGLLSQTNMWDFGVPEVARTQHLLGLGAPGTDLQALLDVAEEARRRVLERWDGPWSGRTVVMQPADAEQIAEIIQATYDVSPYVGFAFWTGGAGDYPGARIIAEPSAFAAASRERALSILTHEMFHVASLGSSGGHTPHFIEEGFAQWVQFAHDPGALERADAYGDGRLPKDHEFFTGSAAEIFAAYQESLSAVRYLVDRWGSDEAVELYVRIGNASGPGTAEWHVDRAFREVLRMPFKEFEEAWASSI